MNIQTLQINNQTMSSREIADLCEKQHGHVKRDIETMCQQIEIDASKFGYTYIDASNRRQFEYMLDKDLTITLVAGYNAQLRYRIVKRWQELEANASSPVIPQSFADALQLAADQARQLELAKPKISHYDNVVERAGLLNATQVAQKVRLSAVAMNKILDELGVYNKAVKRSRVFQQWFIDKGLGEVKQTDQGFSQAMFTKRGEAWIIERLISEGVA
ncbi:Rha family transcriptional regulator [Psychrobacter sp. UBA6291]|uniref:Rha family transcriptional regulator n=1 Tax=Psychrobacter sp. UBA6291 TaxID=1947357 RepID=UPI0025811A28|nr:Rha family transcriptional regulator [Psychrobacter sp. UBA6291]